MKLQEYRSKEILDRHGVPLLAGETAVVMMTEIRGASNAKAKRELGWTLRHPSWRRGFTDAHANGSEAREPVVKRADRRAA